MQIGRIRKLFIRGITLGDQGMFAVGNFLLAIILTRYYDDTAMAAYGIALSIALVLQGIQKNAYLIQNSVLDSTIYRRRGTKILAQHFIAVLPIFAILAVMSAFVVMYAPETLFFRTVVATAACFAIYAQLEFERVLLVKYEKYVVPFCTSFVFVCLMASMFVLHEHLSFYGVLGMLILFSCFKTLVSVCVVGALNWRGGLVLLRSDFRRNSMASLTGVLGASGYTHAPVIALGVFSSPAHAAAFVALRGLIQPIQIVMRSMDVIDKNFFRSSSTNNDAGIWKTMMMQVMLYGGVSLVFAVLIYFFGEAMINTLYKGKHIEFIWLLYGWALVSMCQSIIFPVESAVIIKRLLTTYNFIRLWIGLAVCALCFVVIAPYGAYAALALTGGSVFLSFLTGLYVLKKRMT